MLERSSAKYVILLYSLDMALTALALLAARWLRVVLPYGKAIDIAGAKLHWSMFALMFVIWSIALASSRVYDAHRFLDATDEVQTLTLAVTAATLAFAGALYLGYRGLSRLLYLYFYLLDLAACGGARLVLRSVLRRSNSSERRRVLIVGAGAIGQRIARALQSADWVGLEVLGYLDEEAGQVGQMRSGYPIVGALEQVRQVVSQHSIQEVILALPAASPTDEPHRLANMVADLRSLPANIKVAPDYSDLALYRSAVEELGGVQLIGLKEPAIGPIDRAIKRTFDLIGSLLGLVVLAPLLGLIALAVRLSSSGSLLYRSQRIGESCVPFEMLKFRTMYSGADRAEGELVGETREGELVFDKHQDDRRVTPVGKFLRRFSLDELPQLYNVLIGEMSLVGPRPELPSLVARYEPWQRQRFAVPQGITGWWQISGRSNKAKHLHVEDDLYYLRNYSLFLDWHILWRTLGVVIKGEGAF